MKKRKELDALLLNNMNGKKMSKGSSSSIKEGHELLRNEASWDSNSTENDDFFSPSRKLMIRKPHRWRFCATCIQLCIFVVMMACIVVTGGLIWMHLDLKQDLDELRLRIAKVESSLEITTEQASTVNTLLVKIEQLQKLPTQISNINRQIGALNLTTSQLQVKMKAASNIETLQRTTAQIGSTMQGVQGLQTRHSEQIDTLTSSIEGLKSSLTDLQGEVHRTTPAPTKPDESMPTPRPAPSPTNPTPDTGNHPSSSEVISLKESVDGVLSVISQLNGSLASIQLWKQDLMPRIIALESVSTSDTSDGNLAEKVTKLQTQINTLMGSLHNQTTEMGGQTTSHIASDGQTDWRQEMDFRLQMLQNKLEEDLNKNLETLNLTQALQDQIQEALGVLKGKNLEGIGGLQQDNSAIWGRLLQQHNDSTKIQNQIDSIQVRVHDLESKHATTDHLQLITIEGITTQQDLELNFFKWDSNGDSFLTYEELKDFLGASAPPKDQLLLYDKDGNGKWNLAEMMKALGF